MFADFPIPQYGQPLPEVADYSDAELKAVWAHRSELLLKGGSQFFLTPKPNVKLPVEVSEFVSERQFAAIAATLATLPDGVWWQEDPDKLPGIPIEDLAVRVQLSSDHLVSRKPWFFNESTRAQVIKQLRSEIDMGLFEPAN